MQPQVHLEYPISAYKNKQEKAIAASPFFDAQPLKQQAFPSIGASSLNHNSDISIGQGGLPSLAAAQARSMTRKQNVMASQPNMSVKSTKRHEKSKDSKHQKAIVGIFGDAL